MYIIKWFCTIGFALQHDENPRSIIIRSHQHLKTFSGSLNKFLNIQDSSLCTHRLDVIGKGSVTEGTQYVSSSSLHDYILQPQDPLDSNLKHLGLGPWSY
jgi:hypothetical protein